MMRAVVALIAALGFVPLAHAQGTTDQGTAAQGTQGTAAQKPAVQKPAAKKPGAQKPAAQKAAAQKPAAQKAAVQGSTTLGAARPGANPQDNAKPVGIEAENGIEWQQNNHVYIARGNAKATRGDDTVIADELRAYYRPTGDAQPAATKQGSDDPLSGGASQIYRLEADGHVRFKTPAETLTGDHAVYDVERAVLVVTGKNLKLVTQRDTITARKSLEWYDQKQYGVARGDAVVVRGDRRVRGDVLTARVEKQANGPSRISRIDANGNVMVSAPGQIARGDAGVYNLDTGIATLSGHVRLTRGENELRGRYGVVDLNTNVSRLLSEPPDTRVAAGSARVEGILVPRKKAATP